MSEDKFEVKGIELELQSLAHAACDLSKYNIEQLTDTHLIELVKNARKYLNSLFALRTKDLGYYE